MTFSTELSCACGRLTCSWENLMQQTSNSIHSSKMNVRAISCCISSDELLLWSILLNAFHKRWLCCNCFENRKLNDWWVVETVLYRGFFWESTYVELLLLPSPHVGAGVDSIDEIEWMQILLKLYEYRKFMSVKCDNVDKIFQISNCLQLSDVLRIWWLEAFDYLN